MRRGRVIFVLLVVSVLLLAGALRFVHLRSAPGWYSDEGSMIHFAANLADGRWELFGIRSALTILQRIPVFGYLLALAFSLSGTVDIGVARAVSVLSSLVGVVVLMAAVRRMVGPRLAFWAGLFVALLPWMVAYQRMALTYNLTGLWMLICWSACWWMLNEPNRPGWLLAAISAGLALATDYLGVVAALVLAVVVLFYDRRRFGLVLGVGVLTVGLALLPVLLNTPSAVQEIVLTFWVRGGTAHQSALLSILLNLGELFRREMWIFVGMSGLALLPERRARNLALALVGLTLLLVARSYTPVGYGLHYLLHLFPFFALGWPFSSIRRCALCAHTCYRNGLLLWEPFL
jgi:4-amino-4-deoxy-L-arabinose transferase-like glycosyltransferase